jgi:predicted AAA+ superfamily ATPase
MSTLYSRHAQPLVSEALDFSAVVFIQGARQVGKSTLAQKVIAERGFDHSLTLDGQAELDAALDDPAGFLAGLEGSVFIDEIQRAPGLLLAIKQRVDREQRPGQFLLTGSANVLTAPKVHDALTGRTALITLWPLAQSEIAGKRVNVVDTLLAGAAPKVVDAPIGRAAFVDRVATGGYPRALLASPRQRRGFFADYVTSTLERDLRELADARKLAEMPRLLRLLASRAGTLYSARNVAKALGISHDTVQAYTRLLETVFLVRTVPAWRPGIGSREIQTPKVHLVDSGLLASLVGASPERIGSDDQLTGRLFESFVTMEVARHLDWAETPATQYHYRDRDDEIDIVLEANSGDIAAIEVKAGASPRASDWRGLAKLRDARGPSFRAGVLLYTGAQTIPLGDRLWAVPVSGLWA